MNRSAQLRVARLAGGAVLLAAMIPVISAGSALADDSDPAPAVTATAPADEVAIGTALKIGNPDVVGAPAGRTDAEGRDTAIAPAATEPSASASPSDEPDVEPTDESSSEATPSDAEVIETESHQAATPEPETSVLGTKVGNALAETGTDVSGQLLLALALIAGGAALRFGPQAALAAARRKH